MDVEYPYADDSARLALLYRLPTAPEPRRLLIVGDDLSGRSIAASWRGPTTMLPHAQLEAAVVAGSPRYDAVGLPWLPGERLLASACRLLVPGGVVVGHVENLRTLRRCASVRGLAGMIASSMGADAVRGAGHCKKLLVGHGFVEAACFFVHPNIESPMGLIPSEAIAARAQFLRMVRSSRGQYAAAAYVARWLVAYFGLGGMLQPQLFFWARKPC